VPWLMYWQGARPRCPGARCCNAAQCTWIYIRINTLTFMYRCIQICTHAYTYLRIYVHMYTCLEVYIHMHMYTYIDDGLIQIYTRIYTDIYTYIYIYLNIHNGLIHAGWRRLIGSPRLQIIFHKRVTKYRSLLRKMTYKDKGSCESSPPFICYTTQENWVFPYIYICIQLYVYIDVHIRIYMHTSTYIYISIHTFTYMYTFLYMYITDWFISVFSRCINN